MYVLCLTCRLHDRLDKCVTTHAEHGLMYEDAGQHHRAAYYYKQAILTCTQHPAAAVNENMDSILVGIAEAYDGAWQDAGTAAFLNACVKLVDCLQFPCSSVWHMASWQQSAMLTGLLNMPVW